MKTKLSAILSLFALLISIQTYATDADTIIQKLIAHHGGENYNAFAVKFNFRNKQITIDRNQGLFCYSSAFQGKVKESIVDSLTNKGYVRYVNGKKASLRAIRQSVRKSAALPMSA